MIAPYTPRTLLVLLYAASTATALAVAAWLVWDGRLGFTGIGLATLLAAVGLLGLAATAYNIKHFKDPL